MFTTEHKAEEENVFLFSVCLKEKYILFIRVIIVIELVKKKKNINCSVAYSLNIVWQSVHCSNTESKYLLFSSQSHFKMTIYCLIALNRVPIDSLF